MKVLLFAGAGTSVELGVPAMAGLANGFLDYCRQWSVHPELVGQILVKTMDVEHLIEALDRLCGARPSLEIVGENTEKLSAADDVRAEVEWFVQHSAERVRTADAALMWASVLLAGKEHEMFFVTTNYDRAIELAANAAKVPIDDGFGAFSNGETAKWEGFSVTGESAKLIKLHGSTDWYAMDGAGEPVKLRHPMALFGRSELRLAEGARLRTALILPSREKMFTNAPYLRLSQTFLNAADECDLAIYIGSSLRDRHIAEAVRSTARRVATFVVNPGQSPQIPGAKKICQCASTFLLSTLPNALASDPIKVLDEAASQDLRDCDGILDSVRRLLNPAAGTSSRCDAMDMLDARGLTLESSQVERLLSDDDVNVARYALSLVYGSSHSAQLVSEAQTGKHVSNSAYCEDLGLLQELLSA